MMSSSLPFVSVLIPVKNEEEYIQKCIASMASQDYPSNLYEIIVMDNMSQDNTSIIAKATGVSVYCSNSETIGRVRNELFNLARGEIIAYIDGDCTAPPSWIRETVLVLRDQNVGAVGGYVNRPMNANWLVSGWALRKPAVEAVTNRLATGSFFLRREVFSSVGGFNEMLTAGEDTDISRRIIGRNLELRRVPSASVVHWGYPTTVSSFLKRQIWQTSDYLVTRKSGFDAVFFATLIWVLSVLVVLLSSIFESYELGIPALLMFFFVPGGLAWIRISKSSESLSIAKAAKVYAVSVLYLIGRGVGLSISIWKYVSGRYRAKKYPKAT